MTKKIFIVTAIASCAWIATSFTATVPAGTKFDGKIESSQANPFRSGALILNLTDVSINGHTIPIRTVSGFQVQNLAMRAGARARGISVGPFVAPHGTRLEFRLAQSLNL